MAVNREELKRLIDQIPGQDAIQVYDFIGYLNMKREKDDTLLEATEKVPKVQKETTSHFYEEVVSFFRYNLYIKSKAGGPDASKATQFGLESVYRTLQYTHS